MTYTTHNTVLLFAAIVIALILLIVGYLVGCWRESLRWREEFKWAEPREGEGVEWFYGGHQTHIYDRSTGPWWGPADPAYPHFKLDEDGLHQYMDVHFDVEDNVPYDWQLDSPDQPA